MSKTPKQIAEESDKQLAQRLDDPAGMDRLITDLERDCGEDEEDAERWDGMGMVVGWCPVRSRWHRVASHRPYIICTQHYLPHNLDFC